MLKEAVEQIAKSYPYLVLDNEAGLENLSRRIVRAADLLVMVADPSKRGLDTVGRLYDLAVEMEVRYDRLAIIVNHVRGGGLPAATSALKEKTRADFLLALPENRAIAELGERGESLAGLPEGNPVVEQLDRFLAEAGVEGKLSGTAP